MSTGPTASALPLHSPIPEPLNGLVNRLLSTLDGGDSAQHTDHSDARPSNSSNSSTTMPTRTGRPSRVALAAAVGLTQLLIGVQARPAGNPVPVARSLLEHTDILRPEALSSHVLTAALGRSHPVGTSPPPDAGLNSPRARECAELQKAWRDAGDRRNAAWAGAAVILLELGTLPSPRIDEPTAPEGSNRLDGSSAIALALAAAWGYEHPPDCWIQLTRLVRDELSLI